MMVNWEITYLTIPRVRKTMCLLYLFGFLLIAVSNVWDVYAGVNEYGCPKVVVSYLPLFP